MPWLTPVAGVCLVLLMLGALATHFRRRENHMLIANLVLLGLAVVVAMGRFA